MPVSVRRSPFECAAKEGISSKNSTPEKVLGRRPDSAGDWAPVFIGSIMEGSSIRRAARTAGVDMTMPFKRRQTDEEFKRAWKEAADVGTEFLEQEAARRAYHGTIKPVFHKGEECGGIREYSDTLMIFLLKARKPEVYREGVEDGTARLTAVNINIVAVGVEPAPVFVQEGGGAGVLLEVVSGASDGDKQDGEGLPEAARVS